VSLSLFGSHHWQKGKCGNGKGNKNVSKSEEESRDFFLSLSPPFVSLFAAFSSSFFLKVSLWWGVGVVA